jgi:hypothetical protein
MAINFPDAPSSGDVFVVGERTWSYNGNFWASDDSTRVTVSSDTAPSNPEVGQFWWNSLSGSLYIYYDNFWVQAVTGVSGQAYANIDGGKANTNYGGTTTVVQGGNSGSF